MTAQQPQRELPIYYERLLQSVRYVVLKSHVTYPEYIAGTSNNRRDSIKFMEWLMKENPTAKVRAIGLDEYILESKPFEPRPHTPAPKFSSEDLILLAHDEWKRREERKHNHPEQDWVAGYLNGFCTSRKWAREYVDKLRSKK
jgi:hypothetical protein